MINEYYNPALNARETYHGLLWSSRSTTYYGRRLLQKLMSVFKFKLPEAWDMNYWLYTLFVKGYVGVTNIAPYGVIPQHCTIDGWTIYYNPAKIRISNPYFKNRMNIDRELGENAELVALAPDYLGVMDIVNEYSEMLANASAAVNMNLYNSRTSYMFWAESETQAQTVKKMYDQVGAGQPAVFIDKKLGNEDSSGRLIPPWEPFNAELSKNYITDKVLDDMVKIENSFAKAVGLPQANTTKKERLNVAETNKTDVETKSNVILWHEMIEEGIERCIKMYPSLEGRFSCELRFKEEYDAQLPLQTSSLPTNSSTSPSNNT